MRAGGRAALAAAIVGGGLASSVAACFPDYAIGGARGDGGAAGDDGGPGAGDGGGGDSTMPMGDGATPGDGGRADSTAGDGAAHADGGGASDSSFPTYDSPYDGNPLSNMVQVDGGTFYFQVDTNSSHIDAQATLEYTVAIDKTEVTVGQFEAWVNAGRPLPCDGCSLDSKGPYASVMIWDPTAWGSTDGDFIDGGDALDYTDAGACTPGFRTSAIITYGANIAYPITCVPWPQALAFCAWEGKRLPTDTEWRFFATGQGTRSLYPWGASPAVDCPHAIGNFDGNGCGFPLPVGSALAGISKDGVLDLVGSLSEWLWDWQPSSYAYPTNAGVNYAGPTQGSGPQSRVWIDSDFSSNTPGNFYSTLSGPGSSSAFSGYDNCGFRCAKSLP